jgi:hypothetical protein
MNTNTKTLHAPQLRKALVALVSVALLAAAGPVYSAAGSDEVRLACQSSSNCGG